MQKLVEPRLLKGFRDALPDIELTRKRMVDRLTRTFEQFGFLPVDTPALEYADVLLGKGGGETDKQVYRFTDHGGRDVAMRYDLTVPFARFMAAHRHELYLPFKRYHVAKVWRGENTQRGRYREFYQCDFDTVGVDSVSADLDILLLMERSMRELGIERFRIHIAHRGVFTSLLEKLGLARQAEDVLRTVDKQGKVGPKKVRELLASIVGAEATRTIMAFAAPGRSYEDTLARMREAVGPDNPDVERLSRIKTCVDEMGLGDVFYLDPSITRGLDYYTGIVFETFLLDLQEIGSICSGGRYNNLTSIYSKEPMPGVGASIGLDRLHAALIELEGAATALRGAEIIVLCLNEDLLPVYHRIARQLRDAGLTAEVYPEREKLSRQFQFAEKKGIPFGVICGEDEVRSGVANVRNLTTRESHDGIPEKDLSARLVSLLQEQAGSKGESQAP